MAQAYWNGKCEAEEFNMAKCAKQCARCKPEEKQVESKKGKVGDVRTAQQRKADRAMDLIFKEFKDYCAGAGPSLNLGHSRAFSEIAQPICRALAEGTDLDDLDDIDLDDMHNRAIAEFGAEKPPVQFSSANGYKFNQVRSELWLAVFKDASSKVRWIKFNPPTPATHAGVMRECAALADLAVVEFDKRLQGPK